jgi:hypothetical protein
MCSNMASGSEAGGFIRPPAAQALVVRVRPSTARALQPDLVGVDVVQARQAQHGGSWLQGLLDDGALEFERVAAVRAAWGAMRVLIQLCVHQSIVGTTLGAPSQGNRQLWRDRREDGIERTLTHYRNPSTEKQTAHATTNAKSPHAIHGGQHPAAAKTRCTAE